MNGIEEKIRLMTPEQKAQMAQVIKAELASRGASGDMTSMTTPTRPRGFLPTTTSAIENLPNALSIAIRGKPIKEDDFMEKLALIQARKDITPETYKPTTREEAISFEKEKLGIKDPALEEKEKTQARKDMLNRATELRKEFNASQVLKDYQTVDRGFRALESAYKQATAPDVQSRIASDQALGVLFQKLLDPQSVVRESEYARTPEGAAFFNRIQSLAPQLQKGGLRLADNDRLALVDTAKKLLSSSQDSLNSLIDRYSSLAGQYEIDPNLILGGLNKIITAPNGKRYKIIGGDPNDPDVEEVK